MYRSCVVLALASLLLLAPAAGAAPTWLAPVGMGTELADTSSIGRVAVAPDGTVVAAWSQWTGSAFVVQVRRRPPGGAFGPVITVPSTAGAQSVDVGIDKLDNATISWEQGGDIKTARLSAAGALSAVQPLGSGGSDPVIAVGRSGRAVIAWIDALSSSAPVVLNAVRTGASGAFGQAQAISDIGNGSFTIADVATTVGDNDAASVIWSRKDITNRTVIEVNDRAPSGAFSSFGTAISDLTPGFNAIAPTISIDGTGRETALWTDSTRGSVVFAERPPGQDWSDQDFVSPVTELAGNPAADVAPDGTVVAAWTNDTGGSSVIESAARAPGGGGFAGLIKLSAPSNTSLRPLVSVGRGGHALVSWLPGNGSALLNRLRSRAGTFGPVLMAVSSTGQPAGEFRSFFAPSAGVDDEGNAVALWSRDAFRQSDGKDHYQVQLSALDTAPPTLVASIPPAATAGAAVGMAAAVSDRWSPVRVSWSFGDGTGGLGGAVAHAFATPGAFNVRVTATDAVGNANGADRQVLVTPPAGGGGPPAGGGPPPVPRIDSTVQSNWGFVKRTGRDFYLLRLKVVAPPKGSAAQLRCSGNRCPFQSRRFTKIRKRAITLYANLSPTKATKVKNRRFRAGQLIQIRITAPGYVGKVVEWKLKRGRQPVGVVRCLAPGATRPSAC